MATFFNQATLTYNGNTVTSNIATGEILEVLSAVKTAVTPSYNGDDNVTYAISIVNSGATAFNGLSVTDNLGAYTFDTQTLTPLEYEAGSVRLFVNGALQTPPTVTGTSPITFTGINIPAGGNAVLVYEARTNEFAPLGADAEIANEATIAGAGLTAPITADATIPADTDPRLTISKAISPSVVTENGEVTYTFVIQNFAADATTTTDSVIVTDTFDPIIDITSVTFNGTAWSQPANYTYDDTTGEFATVAGQIIVPGATYTQDAVTGAWTTNPGTVTLVVTGII